MSIERSPPAVSGKSDVDAIESKDSSSSGILDDGPPDGGLDAWMTVLGGWLFYFCGLGCASI